MTKTTTPSKFYKIQRPEFFSDSKIVNKTTLTREVLAYELNQISTNQKQDDFETLCRKLAEKLISPNLIPQVGPTGGGDGKTDFETYPVSKNISDRWFVPENGWNNNENWAFAISAKKDWKPKAKADIKKIIATNRNYSRIYFMTNQCLSSKKRKDAQDEFKEEFNIDIVILDGEWILVKVYNNNLLDLVVKSLHLSSSHQNDKKIAGTNDVCRTKELYKIENNILNIDRYSEYDFQLVEDSLEAAILARMLELPKDSVEGKFDRAIRFCKKINNSKQWLRIYYQRAWTYLYYYDDYPNFMDNFREFKKHISEHSSISEIEKYFTLFHSLNSLHNRSFNFSDNGVDFELERNEIVTILTAIEKSTQKPSATLIAKMYKVYIKFFEYIKQNQNPDNIFTELSKIISQGADYLDFPFESSLKIIEIFGTSFPNNSEYDNLIDNMAKISEQRNSELAAGEMFLKRGGQKLQAKNYQESIIYFGKSVTKLAKEETQHGMHLVLLGMGMAYRELGLIWASNNCYILACNLSFKSINEDGVINQKTYYDIEEIIKNELFIGRISFLLEWYEMYSTLKQTSNINESKKEHSPGINFEELMDRCLSVRLLHTNDSHIDHLPDLLSNLGLYLSEDICLHKLGHENKLITNDLKDDKNQDEFYNSMAKQPFIEQMLYQTNFMMEDDICLTSKILGCEFFVKFKQDIKLLLSAETILAFLESFFSTSINKLMPHLESVTINLYKNPEDKLTFTYNDTSEEYDVFINTMAEMSSMYNSVFELVDSIFSKTFILKNDEQNFFKKIFKREEVQERLSIVIQHKNTTLNLLSNTPKLFLNDWLKAKSPKRYISQRKTPILYNHLLSKNNEQLKGNYTSADFKNTRHDEIKVSSIINLELWGKAKWMGFGFCFLRAPQEAVGIIIAYEDFESGKKIFEKWINKFGKVDKNNEIRVSIIKGVNKDNPDWYRVHICKNIEISQNNGFISSVSRVHEMRPQSSENLEKIINAFTLMKRYKLYPAKATKNNSIENPLFSLGILKTTLIIKNAWEINENDIDRAVIKENDNPITPNDVEDAPILKILK